ncbi:MAG: thermonuclease family protein [Candidatus Thioglobus sp.]|nr:MAG: thermonuclease family protein [Candidatus Thioglobus sp.]
MKLFIFCLLLITNANAIDDFNLNSAKSLYIVDGDSINLKMRIMGIDTAEIGQTCQKIANKNVNCGELSKIYLAKILTQTSGELLIKPVKIDNYYRILVQVYKDGIDIGAKMVKAGMAYSYKDTYLKEQNYAKAKKLGFWGFYQPPISPYKYRRARLNKHR